MASLRWEASEKPSAARVVPFLSTLLNTPGRTESYRNQMPTEWTTGELFWTEHAASRSAETTDSQPRYRQ
jgi:dipeptidase